MARRPFVHTASKSLGNAGKNLNAMLPSRSALLPRANLLSRSRRVVPGGLAMGAFAGGAMALGALAIARLAIGKMAVGHARLGKVEVDDLTVHRLRVTDDAESSPHGSQNPLHPADAEPQTAMAEDERQTSSKTARSTRKRNNPRQGAAVDAQEHLLSGESS